MDAGDSAGLRHFGRWRQSESSGYRRAEVDYDDVATRARPGAGAVGPAGRDLMLVCDRDQARGEYTMAVWHEDYRQMWPMWQVMRAFGQGRHRVRKSDLRDLFGAFVREIDPEIYLHLGGPLASVSDAPDRSGFDAWANGYRRLSDELLVSSGCL